MYKDSKEIAYFLCPDKINDLVLLPPTETNEKVVPVLACHDRVLRILDVNLISCFVLVIINLNQVFKIGQFAGLRSGSSRTADNSEFNE